jgi:hypothetical protein
MKRIMSSIWSTLKSRDFWIGYSQAFNLFPHPEDYYRYPHKSEAEALAADWRTVEDDLRRARAKCRQPETDAKA